eukprot:9636318-Karenia_brevis.AAC.1
MSKFLKDNLMLVFADANVKFSNPSGHRVGDPAGGHHNNLKGCTELAKFLDGFGLAAPGMRKSLR